MLIIYGKATNIVEKVDWMSIGLSGIYSFSIGNKHIRTKGYERLAIRENDFIFAFSLYGKETSNSVKASYFKNFTLGIESLGKIGLFLKISAFICLIIVSYILFLMAKEIPHLDDMAKNNIGSFFTFFTFFLMIGSSLLAYILSYIMYVKELKLFGGLKEDTTIYYKSSSIYNIVFYLSIAFAIIWVFRFLIL